MEVFKNVAINQYHEIKEGETTSNVGQLKTGMPIEFCLQQNYPNPFNPHTTIRYSVGKACKTQIIISNILGLELKRYSIFHNTAGSYEILWDGKDVNGRELSSGLYFYRLETTKFIATRKLLLIR